MAQPVAARKHFGITHFQRPGVIPAFSFSCDARLRPVQIDGKEVASAEEDQHHRRAESGVEKPLTPALEPFPMKESVQNVFGRVGEFHAGVAQ